MKNWVGTTLFVLYVEKRWTLGSGALENGGFKTPINRVFLYCDCALEASHLILEVGLYPKPKIYLSVLIMSV